MSFRLTKAAKILKPKEYSAVFSNGKITRGKYWQIMAKPTTGKARLGLAISKKSHRLAVERNRFKRIAREVFRLEQQALDHWEVVVMARGKNADNPTLFADLKSTLKQASQS